MAAKDKDANRKAVTDHIAKKRAMGYRPKQIWFGPESLVLLERLKKKYKTDEELFEDALAILYVTVEGDTDQ